MPHAGQGWFEEPAFITGIGMECPALLVASGISKWVTLQPHMGIISL